MTETSGTITSVLLPSARVGIYVLDPEIREAARSLADDWRFARVAISIHEGDVNAAIQAFQSSESPEFLMVETKTIDEGFIQSLETLASSCAAHTSAVVVGPDNDVYLYRKLIQMGVSDYLVRPLRKDVIAEVIAKTLIDKLGTTDSRLIALVGAKGGVGTSTLAQTTAMAVANRLNQKTVILDAAGGWSYTSVSVGVEPITTMAEATRAATATDQDSFKRMIVPAGDRLSVLASGADAMLDEVVTSEGFEQIINRLMVTFPALVVDLSGASPTVKRTVIHKAHEVLIVTDATLPSLRSARSLLQEIKTVRGGSDKEVSLVVNMKDRQPIEVSVSDITEAMGRKPALVVPFLPKVFAMAESQGKSLLSIAGTDEIVTGLTTLVRRIISIQENSSVAEKPETNLLGGLLGKLKGK